MKKKNIMKEAGILLIAAALVLSTVAVTANTEDNISLRNRQSSLTDSFAEIGNTYTESNPGGYIHSTGGPVIFEQQPIPDDSTGHGPFSDAGTGFRVYDNFWGLTEGIYDVHWWGLWAYGTEVPTDGDVFEISFCADDGGIPDYNNHIVDFTGTIGTEISYVGTGNFYWDHELFYMEMDLPSPVSLASGWVSFYKTNIDTNSFAMIDALTGDSNAYQTNMGSLVYDLAFELTTELQPELEIGNITGGFGISTSVKNIGTGPAENVVWEVKLEGGIILSPAGGIKTGGPINIPASGEQAINVIAFGFGGLILPLNVVITASADNADPASQTVPAKLILIFVDI